MFRESGFEHEYDTGHVVLLSDGNIALVTGLNIRHDQGRVITVYFVTLDSTREQRTAFAHEIIGQCTSRQRRKIQQTETLPGL